MTPSAVQDKSNPLYKHTKTQTVLVLLSLVDGSRVQGSLHMAPNLRLTDLLNRNTADNPFLAVTEAQILFPTGEVSHYHFFTVNRAMIVCCFPLEEKFRS